MNENLFEIFRQSFPADLSRTFLERPDGSLLSYGDVIELSGRVARVLFRRRALYSGDAPSPWALVVLVLLPLVRPALHWLLTVAGHDELIASERLDE